MLAGSLEQMRTYNELFCIYHRATTPVLIIGGGRVGRATGRALRERQLDYRIIERDPAQIPRRTRRISCSATPGRWKCWRKPD